MSLTPLFAPSLFRRQAAVRNAGEFTTVVARTQEGDTAPKRPAPDIPTLPAGRVTDAKTLADKIVRMGAVRRGEISDGEVGLTHPLARAIVATAALIRSCGPPPSLPSNHIARAIVLCGRKARGTLGTDDALWLADYLGKIEATRELLR
jgi:hypothetical protein